MREYFKLEHVGRDCTDSVDNVRDFCRLKRLDYIGCFAKKVDGEVIGDIIRAGGQYYKAKMSSKHKRKLCGDRLVSTAKFNLYRGFKLDEYWPLDECRVRVEVWDVRIDCNRPLHEYAFMDESSARKVVSPDLDFEIWIDGKEVNRTEFLKQ